MITGLSTTAGFLFKKWNLAVHLYGEGGFFVNSFLIFFLIFIIFCFVPLSNKQRKAIAELAFLFGLIIYGVSGTLTGGPFNTRKEGVSLTISYWAYTFNDIGNWLMIFGPTAIIVTDRKRIISDLNAYSVQSDHRFRRILTTRSVLM